MQYAIELKNVTKKYKDFTLDVSFSLPQGAIMGFVGENGAGKSTTIKLIMDAIKRDSGTITVLGTDNTSKDFTLTKQDIGIVLDEAGFHDIFKAKDINNVMKNIYKNWNTDEFYSYLERFAIPLNKKVKAFSRGMKMKLAIAVALSHDAKLLILDEPTSGLDPMIRDEILEVFNEFTRDENHSVLISSHIISDLEKICDYITFIHNGQLVMCEEKDKLLDEYAILKIEEKDLESIPETAIIRKKQTSFGYELLVKKNEINSSFTTEKTNLETIVLFMAKKEG